MRAVGVGTTGPLCRKGIARGSKEDICIKGAEIGVYVGGYI
jgi:hypothetical protein